MKQLMISRVFQQTHPRKGDETNFVKKVLTSLYPQATYYMCECKKCGWMGVSCCCDGGSQIADTGDYDDPLCPKCFSNDLNEPESVEDMGYYLQEKLTPKHHTIRAGKRWKTGDKVVLKVWSGKPYRSKTIQITPPLDLTVFDFEINAFGDAVINGAIFRDAELVAKNDGLSFVDWSYWFDFGHIGKTFSGQIICWNKAITYP